jgi:hypothetical protein
MKRRNSKYLKPHFSITTNMKRAKKRIAFFKESRIPKNQILWSACKSDQTSADSQFYLRWNGAFTYYFCKMLSASSAKCSRSTLLKNVQDALRKDSFDQVPQLMCNEDLLLKNFLKV